MRDKCVYVHLLDKEVVYIGSGNIRRPRSKSCRSSDHLRVWDNLKVEILASNLKIEQSLVLEQHLLDIHFSAGKLFNVQNFTAGVNTVSFEYISKYLYLSEDSPSYLKWKDGLQVSKRHVNDSNAGSKSNRGYFGIKLNRKLLLAHRIVWVLYNRQDLDTSMVIDHIDGNPSNNTPSNLRAVTQSENAKNRKHKISNTGFKNITESISKKTFQVKWQENLGTRTKSFSYSTKACIKYKLNEHDMRLLALQFAVQFRDDVMI